MPEGEEWDAAAAAARALGEDPSPNGESEPSAEGAETVDAGEVDGPPDPQDADGGGTGRGPFDAVKDRLLSTEPNPPLESEDLSTWNVDAGGRRRIKRGIYKLTGTDGATALEDILLGALEELSDGDPAASTTSSEEESGGDLGPLAEAGELA